MSSVDAVYDQLYREKVGATQEMLSIYREIYNLPQVDSSLDVSKEFFEYVKGRENFLVLVVYDSNKKIYLHSGGDGWALPGGTILSTEAIHDSVARIARKISAQIKIGEIEPVVFVENKFSYKEKRHSHFGIGFMARVRNLAEIEDSLHSGRFTIIGDEELEDINAFANRAILEVCLQKLLLKKTKIQEQEIATNEKYFFRYRFHNSVVKKLLLTDRLKKKDFYLRSLASKLLSGPVLDASCGDDSLVSKLLEIHEEIPFAVANDISWSQLKMINNLSRKVILTNHDATQLPYRENAFGTVLCCNTLHHMPSREHMKGLLNSLFKVGRKIVIVEIENPEITGGFPRFLNKYWYRKFLKDVGGAYLQESDFQRIIMANFSDLADVAFSKFSNIQGNYLIAEICKKEGVGQNNHHVEVEEKFYMPSDPFIINRLTDLGFKLQSRCTETDTYFTDLSGDYVKNRTCLRIRQRDAESDISIDFKGKSDVMAGGFAKIESNLNLLAAHFDDVVSLFSHLGFYRYVDVVKQRAEYKIEKKDYTLSVLLDDLPGLGSFIEVEAICPPGRVDVNELKTIINETAKSLRLRTSKTANAPYRDFVAWKQKENFTLSGSYRQLVIDLGDFFTSNQRDVFSYKQESLLALELLTQSFDVTFTKTSDLAFFEESKMHISLALDKEGQQTDHYLFLKVNKDGSVENKDLSLNLSSLMQLYLILSYANDVD